MEKPDDISDEQLMDWIATSMKEDNESMEKAPALFKRGEGIDEVPNEIDDKE